jgi:two-component system phosphate regulon sensor histidine kinase PhoR
LLTRQSADADIVDQRGARIWSGPTSIDQAAVIQPLSTLAGWRIRVAARAGSASAQRSWQTYGLVVLPIVVLAFGLVMMIRLVRREVALARRQAEFTAAVTHEFKSPITSLRLLMERIAAGRISTGPALDQYHEAMTKETDRLDGLVNRLLDAQQIQAGRRNHVPVPALVVPIVEEAVSRFRPQAAAKGIDLRIEVPREAIELNLDRHSISDALDNLIDNAIKYSPAGTVVTVDAKTADGGVEVHVRDEGAGIHRDDLAHVFEPYYRGRLGDRESVRGTGLGLALVRAAATAHGGTVDVTSAPGKGSCFTLRLPGGAA